MNTDHGGGPRCLFWTDCVLGVVWNAGGAANYLMQTNPDFVSTLPASHQTLIAERPAWATAGFALGVFGGVLGCVLLMGRRRLAEPVLLLSLLGIGLTAVYTLNLARGGVAFTGAELVVIVFLPVVVALGLLVYARRVVR